MTGFEKQTFLVVDDEEFSRGMVQRMLKRAGALEVITVEDGHQAIEALNQLPITVMVTDFHMPGIHGLQLLKHVRTGRTKAPRNLICAMLTGHAVRHLVGLAIVLDVDSFLAKPVSPEILVKHLSRSFQYRFEPLPAENYDRVDVARADVFLTGRTTAAPQPFELSRDMQVTEDDLSAPMPEDEEIYERPIEKSPERAPDRPTERPASPRGSSDVPRSAPRTFKPEPPREIKRPLPGKMPPGEAVRVSLSEVPENAVLARDIIGTSGTLLLAKGTPFRSRYVRRLQELKDMEGDVDHIWIHPL